MICLSGEAAEAPPSAPHELKLKLKLEHGLRALARGTLLQKCQSAAADTAGPAVTVAQ